MKSEYSNIDRIAMLFELGLQFHKEFKVAMDNGDAKRADHFHHLTHCVKDLLTEVDKEDRQ